MTDKKLDDVISVLKNIDERLQRIERTVVWIYNNMGKAIGGGGAADIFIYGDKGVGGWSSATDARREPIAGGGGYSVEGGVAGGIPEHRNMYDQRNR